MQCAAMYCAAGSMPSQSRMPVIEPAAATASDAEPMRMASMPCAQKGFWGLPPTVTVSGPKVVRAANPTASIAPLTVPHKCRALLASMTLIDAMFSSSLDCDELHARHAPKGRLALRNELNALLKQLGANQPLHDRHRQRRRKLLPENSPTTRVAN